MLDLFTSLQCQQTCHSTVNDVVISTHVCHSLAYSHFPIKKWWGPVGQAQ